ncbi:MAG: tetratricopeptide repeat protein [Alphaproteobacteria bacterium]
MRKPILPGRVFLSATMGMLLVAMAGCDHSPAYIDRANPPLLGSLDFVWPVEFQVFKAYRDAPPTCVAVQPFTFPQTNEKPVEKPVDKPSALDPTEIVRRAVYGHLAAKGTRLVELPRVDFVRRDLSATERNETKVLGAKLNCDALMTGEVTEYDSTFFGLYSRVAVGANLRLVRAGDGVVLWEGSHVAVSHGGSIPLSPIGIGMGLLDAANNVREEQQLRLTEDLARRLVSTLPDPHAVVQDEPLAPPVTIKPSTKTNATTGDDVEGQADRARRLADQGDYAGALAAADRVLAIRPNDHATHFLKGRVLTRLNDLDGAERSMIRAVALEDANAGYYNGIGYVASLRGDDERALAAYDMAIQRDAGNAFAHFNLGVTYLKQGADAKAAEAFVRAGNAYLDRGDYANVEKVLANLQEISAEGLRLEEPIATLKRALDSVAKKGLPPHA